MTCAAMMAGVPDVVAVDEVVDDDELVGEFCGDDDGDVDDGGGDGCRDGYDDDGHDNHQLVVSCLSRKFVNYCNSIY